MNKMRGLIFLLLFSGMNIAFVPLLSLYGLRVCPVLSIPGFGFGCYYTGLYIGTLLFLNYLLLFALGGATAKGRLQKLISRFLFCAVAGIYFFATIISLAALQLLLHFNHLSASSRAPQILGFASLLLGITQAYGMAWAFRRSETDHLPEEKVSFRARWLGHVARTMLPIVVAGAVLLHFLIGQSVSFNEGQTAPLANHDEMIRQTAYLVYFLLCWLMATFFFHFLSERDQVKLVQSHLNKVSEGMNTGYRSPLGGTWGLWRAILEHLNLFSKTLGERTRLLSAFSKFVSEGVAREVLSADALQKTGITREMTVLMIDIRNFTALSENLSPAQVVELLNEYFSSMLNVVAGLPIAVDKFIGDGILAYVETAEDAGRENQIAVNAAFAMIAELGALGARLSAKALPPVKIGIGIYRGPLVLGLIGTEAKMQHTIIGDTVNRVARLEGLCRDLGMALVISGWIWHSLESEVQSKFKAFGKRTVKGIAEEMDIFGYQT